MTDELSIQQQPRQNGNYAVAGTVLGAGLGAAGGAATSYWTNLGYKSKADYDKVIAMKEDSFKREIERGGDNKGNWEKLQELTKKVQDAEAEYDKKIDELVKAGGVTDAELPQNLVDKRDNAQKALDSLIEQKKAELSNKGGSTINTKKFPNFDTINTADLPTTNVKSGKPFKNNQLETVYNNLTNEVKNAETALDNALNSGLRKEKEDVFTRIKAAHRQAFGDLRGKSDKEISAYFAEKETGGWLTGKRPSVQYQRAIDIANIKYPEPTTLTNEEFIQISQDLEAGKKVPTTGYSTKVVKYKAENGRELFKTVIFNDNQAQELLENKKTEAARLRTIAADEIFAETQKAVALQNELNGLATKFEKSVDKAKAELTGLYTPASAGSPDSLNITQIINEGSGKLKFNGKEGYSADIQQLEQMINNAKKSGTTATLPTSGLNSNFAAGTSVEDALKQLRARNEIYKLYSKQVKSIQKQYQECLSNNSIIREIDDKIVNELANNERLNKARAALAEQFPALFSDSSKELSTDEIASKVKEMQVVKDAELKLQGAKDEIAKYAEEKGIKTEITREKAIEKFGKSKSEYTQAVKDEVKTEIDKLCEKVKIRNPKVTALIGAGALALVGLGIGAASKKSAPEEEIA